MKAKNVFYCTECAEFQLFDWLCLEFTMYADIRHRDIYVVVVKFMKDVELGIVPCVELVRVQSA